MTKKSKKRKSSDRRRRQKKNKKRRSRGDGDESSSSSSSSSESEDEHVKAAREAKKEAENEKKASEIWKEPLQIEQEKSREENFDEFLEDLFMWKTEQKDCEKKSDKIFKTSVFLCGLVQFPTSVLMWTSATTQWR